MGKKYDGKKKTSTTLDEDYRVRSSSTRTEFVQLSHPGGGGLDLAISGNERMKWRTKATTERLCSH